MVKNTLLFNQDLPAQILTVSLFFKENMLWVLKEVFLMSTHNMFPLRNKKYMSQSGYSS